MTDENRVLTLLNKHLTALDLAEPVFFRDENDLLENQNNKAKSAVIYLPKSKGLIDMALALVSGIVEENGRVVLAGEKGAGIESAKKLFEKNIGPVGQKIAGNHSALYIGRNKKLSSGKKLEDFLSYSRIKYGGVEMEIANLPGVFSAGELDEGTELLLDNIPYDKKKILDVGCGSGIIGAIYKKNSPESETTMSDSSKLALIAAQKTFEKNSLDGKFLESDVFGDIAGNFDLILTNPPFHKGIGTDYSFIEKFAIGAKRHLSSGGEIYVVANSFLPYGEILKKYFGKADIITDTKKFRIYRLGL